MRNFAFKNNPIFFKQTAKNPKRFFAADKAKPKKPA